MNSYPIDFKFEDILDDQYYEKKRTTATVRTYIYIKEREITGEVVE